MIEVVRKGLAQFYDSKLVDELLAAYTDTKRNFYLGNLRPSEVEGGLEVGKPALSSTG